MTFETMLEAFEALQMKRLHREILSDNPTGNGDGIHTQCQKRLKDLIWIRDLMIEQKQNSHTNIWQETCLNFNSWLRKFEQVERDLESEIKHPTKSSLTPIQKAEKAILNFSVLLDTSHVLDLAKALYDQDKIVAAMKLFKILYDSDSQILGPHHLHTLYMQNQIGGCLKKLKELDKALDLFSFLYEKHMHMLGPDHEDTLVDANNIAMILHDQGKYKEALQWYQEVYDGHRERQQNSDPNSKEFQDEQQHLELHQLQTQFRMAECLEELKQYDKALDLFQSVYLNYDRIFGRHHEATLTVQHTIAWIVEQQGRLEEACKIYEQVFEVELELFGSQNLATLNTKAHIDEILKELKCKE